MRLDLSRMTCALVLSMAAGAASAQDGLRLAQAAPETSPAAQRLVGVAAWNAVVGNSITGKEDGEILVEYYAPDGTAKSMLGNEIVAGKWALVGETVCFQYTDDKEMECYKVEVTGDSATFIDPNGTGSRYDILKGNPKGL